MLPRSVAVDIVRRWVLTNMPTLPAPDVEAVTMDVNGRVYVRATVRVAPLALDVLVSQETD